MLVFKPPLGQLAKARRQRDGRGVSGTATGLLHLAHVNLSTQERAGGQHNRVRGKAEA